MAQRWYLRSSGTPSISPTIGAEWEHINTTRLLCSPTGGATALSNVAYSPDAADHLVNADAHVIQFVSVETLAAQTMSAQTVTIAMQCLESNAGNNVSLTWKIWVVSTDGTTQLGGSPLLAIRRDATEMATSRTNRTDSATTTSITTAAEGRLVIEVGCGGTPTGAGGVQGHNSTLFHGDNSATDLPADDADTTTTKRPWVEFATGFTFSGPTIKHGRLARTGVGHIVFGGFGFKRARGEHVWRAAA